MYIVYIIKFLVIYSMDIDVYISTKVVNGATISTSIYNTEHDEIFNESVLLFISTPSIQVTSGTFTVS